MPESDTRVLVGLGTGRFLVLTCSKRSGTLLTRDFRRKKSCGRICNFSILQLISSYNTFPKTCWCLLARSSAIMLKCYGAKLKHQICFITYPYVLCVFLQVNSYIWVISMRSGLLSPSRINSARLTRISESEQLTETNGVGYAQMKLQEKEAKIRESFLLKKWLIKLIESWRFKGTYTNPGWCYTSYVQYCWKKLWHNLN